MILNKCKSMDVLTELFAHGLIEENNPLLELKLQFGVQLGRVLERKQRSGCVGPPARRVSKVRVEHRRWPIPWRCDGNRRILHVSERHYSWRISRCTNYSNKALIGTLSALAILPAARIVGLRPPLRSRLVM